MDFDHVHFQVDNRVHWHNWFAEKLKFCPENADLSGQDLSSTLTVLTQGMAQIRLSPLPSDPLFSKRSPTLFSSPVDFPGREQSRLGEAKVSGVRDVAFRVPHLERAIARVLDAGGTLVSEVRSHASQTETRKQATVLGWGNLRHTLVERVVERGGYSPPDKTPELADAASVLGLAASDFEALRSKSNSSKSKSIEQANAHLTMSSSMRSRATATRSTLVRSPQQPDEPRAAPLISAIDHVVLNVPKGEMEPAVQWYVKAFGLERQQRFSIYTERSALHSQVLRHPDGNVQFPINEPASPHSQIQEFLDAYGGAGIQHIALRTERIVEAIAHMRNQGVAFLDVPPTYYEQLRSRSEFSPELVDWEAIARLKILVDWPTHTPEALLLQTFTQPIFEQPTFFFEIIQRQSYQTPQGRQRVKGFGEGNFQALFEAVEREQMKRGQL